MKSLFAALLALLTFCAPAYSAVIYQAARSQSSGITAESTDVDQAFYGFNSSFGTLLRVEMVNRIRVSARRSFYCKSQDGSPVACSNSNLEVKAQSTVLGSTLTEIETGNSLCGQGRCTDKIGFRDNAVFVLAFNNNLFSSEPSVLDYFTDPAGGVIYFNDLFEASQHGSPLCVFGPCDFLGLEEPALTFSTLSILRYYFDNGLKNEIYRTDLTGGAVIAPGYSKPAYIYVPEPSSGLLMVFALIGLFLRSRHFSRYGKSLV
jgi:hypothetical protein